MQLYMIIQPLNDQEETKRCRQSDSSRTFWSRTRI